MNPFYKMAMLYNSGEAEQEYARNHAAAMSLLSLIREGLENAPAPGGTVEINWAHVGSLSHVNNQLQEIVRFLNADNCPVA